jgi:hypothetical protein
VLAAAVAAAQSPLPPAATPAKTAWQPFPAAPAAAPPPVALPSAAPVASPPAAPIGTRVVVFQKPAGGDQPLAPRTEDGRKVGDPAAPKASYLFPPDPKPADIRLLDDPQLDVEILRAYNQKQLDIYNRSTEPDKKKPPTMSVDSLPPSKDARFTAAPAAPRSTLGAPASVLLIEPGYVVHRRLFFEEKNSERYGWNLGVAQPFVSAGYFYKDLLLYPIKAASNWREPYDTSAGKALPGSPVPYLLYPPEVTFGGLVVGSTAIVGAVFLLP